MDPANLYYSFISRFLDNDIPTVNANFKEFLLKDGVIQMLMSFITLNFPPTVKRDEKDIAESANGVPMEVIKSYRVMDLFVHPTPPFISLAKEKLQTILSTLFEIFNYTTNNNNQLQLNRIEQPKGNMNHFSKVIQCLFNQFTYDTVNALAEIYPLAQRSYFQVLIENLRFPPVKEILLVISKRAARSVNEYQTTNPLDTKKIQKGLVKSKLYNFILNHFSQATKTIDTETNYADLEGCSEFMIRCIEELNIYGPDVGLQFCHFQSKDFSETLGKMILNEGGKKYTFPHRQLAVSVVMSLVNKSNDHANSNQYQAEKDSIFSSGITSWTQFYSFNHMNSVCKLLIDMGADPSFKKTLTSFRIDTLTLLIELIKYRSTQSKKKTSNQTYIPNELWSLLVDWFFQFNNVYHSKFYHLLIELFSQNHLPSIKHFCSQHLKRFIQYYCDVTTSDSRGIVLLLCNYIRLTGDTQSQTNSSGNWLPSFLKSSDNWQMFLPQLLNDTLKQYQTTIPSSTTTTPNGNDNKEQIDLVQGFSSINLGSDFADSIGFEVEDNSNKKKKTANNGATKMFVVDEIPATNAEQLAKIEQELLEEKPPKKSNKKK